MGKAFFRRHLGIVAAAVIMVSAAAVGGVAIGQVADDTPTRQPGVQPPRLDESAEEALLQRDLAFITRRTAGDIPLDNQEAGALRAAAARTAARLKREGVPVAGPATFGGSWAGVGPNPIVQVTRAPDGGGFAAVSGRIAALAIRPSNGQLILGAAQGGIWLYDSGSGTWSAKTDDQPTLSIGALAIAPSNDSVVYAGTGEGALSGDSYFGNGVLKSTDGGTTWAQISGDYFEAVSISRLVVDPTDANHLYAAVLRGRGGARRTSPRVHSRFGVWESKDGGTNWNLLKEAKQEANGATDLEIDPRNPSVLYASFWGDAIYKTTDAGKNWSPIMTGLPVADYAGAQTRFSISLSHPSGPSAVLYAGFDWIDATGDHPSRVFKSTNDGASWAILPAGTGQEKVEDYCGGQCFYDNVIEADPTNPNVVFAGGQFAYDIGSGGIFRSDDGGTTWRNLGWDQHPDFHALAFNSADTAKVAIGSDGGVWYSPSRGGRPNAADPLSAVTWQNLNGTVNRNNAAVTARSGLQISQFTSIANVPTVAARVWGGTQDNGTIRKSAASNSWFDVASGDGGQVLVDPTNANYVYGTYFGISPYRFSDGGLQFFSNQFIRNGIDLADRADFYVPFVMNRDNPNQLFLGTYRLYRTDNAKSPSAGSVSWSPISPDLTSGCPGTAPNGARNCSISAIGVGGGQAVYTGSLDGLVYVSPDAQVNGAPSWTRLDTGKLPKRPVTQIAVDRGNYRIAYFAYAGFNAATPSRPGHVYRTTDGGQTFADISGNLPDTPVNSVILDPSFANTLYVGTDVGPFVTVNGGVSWSPLGTGIPSVAIWQLDLDASHRTLAAGTHGRGAFRITDASPRAALTISKADAGVPIGASSTLQYTLTVRNIGNAAATGVVITDPVPANTSFVSADSGGVASGGVVTWSGITLPAGGSVSVHLTVSVADALKNKVKSVVNDGFKVTSAEGPFSTGSPAVTDIASAFAVSLAPATQTDGARAGSAVSYSLTAQNLGYTPDSYTFSASGGTFPVSFFDATCTTPLAATPTVLPGATTTVCVKVDVPGASANGATSTATVKATSVGSPAVSATAVVKTIAVAVDTLLVDNDDNNPDVQGRYSTALTAAGVAFSTWDLKADANLPLNYLKAFKNVVWFTGNTYPGPILPYEGKLAAFLDGGGRLFLNGQDLLDQAAGTTAFVHDYLHISWDGSETQNDKATATVSGTANPLTAGIGTIPLDTTVLGNAFMDRITPNGTAVTAFVDSANAPNALSFAGGYKVVFLAFPFEEYGSATDRAAFVTRVMTFFGP